MKPSSNIFNHHRVMTLLAAAVFLVMPLFSAGAPDAQQGIQPPTVKTTSQSAETPAVRVTAVGTIKERGITSYMYGTHVLVNENGRALYALKSDRIDLDTYVGRRVTVCGELIDGYPVDNGPGYLDVSSLRDEGSGSL